MMLLAPKTLWAIMNLIGSEGGKYGAKTHLSTHRRRRILQAAHGLTTTAGGGIGEVAGEEEDISGEEEDEDVNGEQVKLECGVVVVAVAVVLPLHSIVCVPFG